MTMPENSDFDTVPLPNEQALVSLVETQILAAKLQHGVDVIKLAKQYTAKVPRTGLPDEVWLIIGWSEKFESGKRYLAVDYARPAASENGVHQFKFVREADLMERNPNLEIVGGATHTEIDPEELTTGDSDTVFEVAPPEPEQSSGEAPDVPGQTKDTRNWLWRLLRWKNG